jgi:hypothetical protein
MTSPRYRRIARDLRYGTTIPMAAIDHETTLRVLLSSACWLGLMTKEDAKIVWARRQG